MKRCWVMVVLGVLLMVGGAVRGERVVVEQAFSAGEVPAGWERGEVAEGEARYDRGSVEGTGVLRIEAVKGMAELSRSLEGVGKEGAFYRLAIKGRSVGRAVVQVGIRPAGANRMVWSARREMLEVMAEQALTFDLPKLEKPAELVVVVPEGESAELVNLSLVEMGRDELIERMKQENPKGGATQNLLRVSKFPQGVESGGAIGRERSDEEYEVGGDPNVVGPSGAAALRLRSDKPVRFILPPAEVPWTFAMHSASVWVRGRGTGSIGVLGDGTAVASKAFTVDSAEWRRVEVTFRPGFLARQHQVVLEVAGEVWADAFQLEPGDQATEYAKRTEVSLAVPKTDASVMRIQFDDDPAIVNFVVTGAAANCSLNAKVFSIYGDQRQLPDVALVGGATAQGSLQYVVFAGRSYGAFRLEAWVEDQFGKATSPVNEIVITRVPRARWWSGDAPESPFGLHLGPVKRQMLLAKAVGINWARLHDAGVESVGWSFVEPTKGQWVWKDEEIKRYRDHHISLLGTLQQSPGWASGIGKADLGYWDRYLAPKDPADWENYVREVTSHYRDSIQAWDVWNEPWLAKFFMRWDAEAKRPVRSKTAAQDYARLSSTAFMAAKSVMPTVEVVGLNSTGGQHGRAWTRDVAAADGLTPCDIYGYHSYTNETAGFPGGVAERHFQDAMAAAVEKLGGKLDKPVWMTEGSGTNFLITRGFYRLSAPGEDPQDALDVADKCVRYVVATLGQGVSKVFLYHTNVGGEFRPGAGEYRSLVTDDGYPEPSAAAHAVMAWHLEGKRFVKRVELVRGVYAWIFRGEHRSVAVLTSSAGHEKYVLPTDVIALDVRDLFGNPVREGDVYGGRTTYVDLQGTEEELEKALAHKGTRRAGVVATTGPSTRGGR